MNFVISRSAATRNLSLLSASHKISSCGRNDKADSFSKVSEQAQKGAVHSGGESAPFWNTTPLNRMSPQQWESLCDRCGRCCLHKIEDEATGRIIYTSLACRLLDKESCLCMDYENRRRVIPWCVTLTPSTADLPWLPSTCAYRLLARGKELPWWHPLVSGTTQSVHEAGMSARSMVLSKKLAPPNDLEDYLDERDQDLVSFDREHIEP